MQDHETSAPSQPSAATAEPIKKPYAAPVLEVLDINRETRFGGGFMPDGAFDDFS